MDIKKWLFRIIWIPVLLAAVVFLIANRQPVAISLDPINAQAPALTTFAAPLWAWLMLMLFTGFAAGAAGMWLSGRSGRVAARTDRRAVKDLRKEVTRLETRLKEAEGAASASVPAVEAPLLESEDA